MTDNTMRDKFILSMCLTWRHDFGLNRAEDGALCSGMTPAEREALLRNMAQLYDHHVAPLVAALSQQTGQAVTLTDADIVRLANKHFHRGKVYYVNANQYSVVTFARALLAKAASVAAEPVARIEQLRKGLFEARDAMRVMSNWVKKSDPAGHSWAVHMVDRANTVLGHAATPPAANTRQACDGTVGNCPNECSAPCSPTLPLNQKKDGGALSDETILGIARKECQLSPWGIGTTRKDFLKAVRAILSRASSSQVALHVGGEHFVYGTPEATAIVQEALYRASSSRAEVEIPEAWREFVERVSKQTPEKPDYWSSCSQCDRNISDAEDLLAAAEAPKGE